MILESLRGDQEKPGLIFNGGKAGGISKTGSMMDVASIAILARLDVGFIDADRSTGALTKALGNSQFPVEKLVDESGIAAKIFAEYKDCDFVFQDNGAIGIADPSIMGITSEIIQAVGINNSCLCLNLIPHKSGVIEDISQIFAIYHWLKNRRIFHVNIDGSGKFDALPELLARAPITEIPHLTASQIDVYSRLKILPAELLLSPPMDRQLVCKQIASRLLQIAQSNNFAAFLGAEAAIAVLQAMAVDAPRYVMPDGFVSSDEALREYNDLQIYNNKALFADTEQLRIQHLNQSRRHLQRFNELKEHL